MVACLLVALVHLAMPAAASPSDAELLQTLRAPSPRYDSRAQYWAKLGLENAQQIAREAADGGLPGALEGLQMHFGLSPETSRALAEAWTYEARVRRGARSDAPSICGALSTAATSTPGNLFVAAELARLVPLCGTPGAPLHAELLFDYLDRGPFGLDLARKLQSGGDEVGSLRGALLAYQVMKDPSLQGAVAEPSRRLYGAARVLVPMLALRSMPANAPSRAELTAEAITAALDAGLPLLAAQLYLAAPPPMQKELAEKALPARAVIGEYGRPLALGAELAVALHALGRPDFECVPLLPRSVGAGGEGPEVDVPGNFILRVIDGLFHGEHDPDPFELAVVSTQCSSEQCGAYELGAAELLQKGYPQVARRALARFVAPPSTDGGDRLRWDLICGPQLDGALAPVLAQIVDARRAQQALVDALRAKLPQPPSAEDPARATVARLLDAAPSSPYRELPLPAKLPKRAWTAASPSLPEGFQLVRADQQGERVVAIALSSRLDPGGEVSAGAYWLLESRDGGRRWLRPTYLGLPKNQPYVVARSSSLDLVSGDSLTMEVSVRELDRQTITFPPVALGVKRSQDGLYLRARLADLRRDTDGDGLPDLMEQRLLLDPKSADTDGDGLTDDRDPIPHVPSQGRPQFPPELMAEFIEEITGAGERPGALVIGVPERADTSDPLARALGTPEPLEDAPVLYVEGERADFVGFASPQKLIVLTPEEVERASARFGVFYPMQITTIINKSGDRAYIEYSERWRGGSYEATRTKGEWTLTMVSSWVT